MKSISFFWLPWLLASLASLPCGAAPVKPAELVRAEICLNGEWETVLNAGGDKIPSSGWEHRRAPSVPLVAPTTSIWYKRSFSIPRDWLQLDRRFLLKVEKAGHYAAVYCNGRRITEHYGQYDPIEADLTDAFQPGKPNEIAIYAHNASGKYARPGIEISEPFAGNAYRGAADQEPSRNWVGITGDIAIAWRPAAHIEDVFVAPSVRQKRLEARVTTAGASGLSLRTTVLDGGRMVLEFPETPLKSDGVISIEAPWANPVLWGPPPYGQPKLYTLRTELVKDSKVVDRSFTRFGFREVWVSGRDVMLNGKKLWMAGTYFGKLGTLRYINDRRPQSLMISIMQASGLNTLHGHWDDLGKPWMDVCDEMGMLVLAGFYCDGRPQIQSKADEGWPDWMTGVCARWVRATRNHASIVMWRPMDVVPGNMSARKEALVARLAEQVRREDGTRPLADESDITAWSQSMLKDQGHPGVFDDASRMAEHLASVTKPLLTKEIYGGFGDFPNLSLFFRAFYEKSWKGGSTGVIVQQLPLTMRAKPFHIAWLSESGAGNRDTRPGELQNWCDPAEPAWTPGNYSTLFAELHGKFTGAQAPSQNSASELLVSGLAPDDLAVLVPDGPEAVESVGVRAAADGTAWIVAPQSGDYRVHYLNGSREVRISPGAARKPGYDYVQRISVKKD